MVVTREQWLKAQEAERAFHNEDFDAGYAHYAESYDQYFKWLGIERDQKGKKIVEIGPADFPALAYCSNYHPRSFIIEPMPSDHLKRFGIPISTEIAEFLHYTADEVWLFNVLQHVIDPNEIVKRAKEGATVIRFFEPINYGIDTCHPWNLTKEMFDKWFADCVKIYPAGQDVRNFHTWECAYGVWNKK